LNHAADVKAATGAAGGGGAIAGPVKASVLVMTYNHARLIRQAVDSVLMQRTGFDYEVVISEDCSTDGTREIVMDYHRRLPDRVRLLLSERNLNSLVVVSRGIRACRGAFIALLDGDDYWTDPQKLQLQVEFLESHPDCSACFHNATSVYDDSSQAPQNWTPPGQKAFMTQEDIWRGNPIATGSTVFRNGLYELPQWYDEMPMPLTDWPLHVLNAEHGTIGYINRVMSVYRIHEGGTYSRLAEVEKFEKRYQFYTRMNRNMNYRCDSVARNGLFYYFLEWAEEYKMRGEWRRVGFCVRKCLAGRPIRKAGYKRLFRVLRWLLSRSVREVLLPAGPVGR
jgi:glycosyltransferase involved in cell wall biosynthesis